jgi:hypothetical protein
LGKEEGLMSKVEGLRFKVFFLRRKGKGDWRGVRVCGWRGF